MNPHIIKLCNDSKTLILNGKELTSHEIISKIGKGANGTVYLGRNKNLDRKEAIKIWQQFKKTDSRDKLQQGINESRKLAITNKEYAVEIYSLEIIENIPVATMEYINGQTLREFKRDGANKNQLFYMAKLYLQAIEMTSKINSIHGDPHLSNVLLYKHHFHNSLTEDRIKLCDFGTSAFTGKNFSEERHWRIVEESILELTDDFRDKEAAKIDLCKHRRSIAKILSSPNEHRTDYDLARIRTAPLKDYLDYLSMEIRR